MAHGTLSTVEGPRSKFIKSVMVSQTQPHFWSSSMLIILLTGKWKIALLHRSAYSVFGVIDISNEIKNRELRWLLE